MTEELTDADKQILLLLARQALENGVRGKSLPTVNEKLLSPITAALEDYRFPPVHHSELAWIKIEISRLTIPQTLIYKNTDDLVARLRPGIDGVILRDSSRRATFLPQVWAQIPEKEKFLSHLCVKMGADPQYWQQKHIDVQIYQVEDFHEDDKPADTDKS
ncbi:MAG: AmmeMemoRadiSam system protein A [Chloroflexi bacterium]|nr:AmmeMemoRadiSam system protein A [Chloroflexota bacterium]